MRGTLVLSVVMVGALLLAGCSGSSSSSSSSTSGTSSKALNTTKTQTKALNVTPNLPPIILLKVTNSTGAVSNVTFIQETPRTKGNLTFSAVGSKDPDADGLSAIAITVQDANRTYPPGVLFSAGTFRSVTYSFDRAGPVNVTVSGIDVRGDVTTVHSMVYVDLITTPGHNAFKGQNPPGLYSAGDCSGPTAVAIIDGTFWEPRKFTTEDGTKWVEATVTKGKGSVEICDPAGKSISNYGTTATTTKGTAFAPTVGDQQYYLSVVSTSAGTPPAGNDVVVGIIVHYEPQP